MLSICWFPVNQLKILPSLHSISATRDALGGPIRAVPVIFLLFAYFSISLFFARWLDIRSKVSQVGQKSEVTQPLSRDHKKNIYRVVWQKCGLWLFCRGIVGLHLRYNRNFSRLKYIKVTGAGKRGRNSL